MRVFRGVVVVLLLAAGLEGATWIWHTYKVGPFPTYLPRHLFDFYRFYRVNPAYRSPNVRVNTAGFRNDEEISREKPSGVIRIVMLGGSTVWGEDAGYPFSGTIDNRDTIAAHLETALNARARERAVPVRVQVLNAGVVGYLLFQNVIYFNHYIARFKPDLVIAMDGHNDLDAMQLAVEPYRHRNDGPFYNALNHPGLLDVAREAIRWAESKSLFVRKASAKLTELASRWVLEGADWREKFERRPSEAELEAWLAEYEASVRRLDASACIAGARALFVVQVEVAGERAKTLTPEEQRIREHYRYYTWLHTVARDRLIDRMNLLVRQHGLWFEDMSAVFRNESEQTYLDYTHLTSRGARIVAERLAQIVEATVFSRAEVQRVEGSLRTGCK
jgi:lysophospholipase L1-like esterase